MKKKNKGIVKILILLFSIIFVVSLAVLIKTVLDYRATDELYENLASGFTVEDSIEEAEESIPIKVDFEELQKLNEDIVGWIYCEGTVIDYPVLQGTDNDFYLHHAYDKSALRAGSIFMDSFNRPGFVDSNMIIYGHHMKSGAMFASLKNWAEQEYYEEHPVMWLLTPEKNYKIILFSGYVTPAVSDTYVIYQGPCPEFEEYLREVSAKSDFSADVELDANGKYVVLSTCDYVFTDARYVLHGMLEECN